MSNQYVLLRAAMVGLTAVLVACCSQQQSAEPGVVSSAQGTAAAPASPAAAQGEVLTVEPANREACNAKGAVVAVVRWKSTHPQVKVMETNPGEPTRLFSGGGYAGRAITGPWVVTETRFALVDVATGATLATATIDRSTCAQ